MTSSTWTRQGTHCLEAWTSMPRRLPIFERFALLSWDPCPLCMLSLCIGALLLSVEPADHARHASVPSGV